MQIQKCLKIFFFKIKSAILNIFNSLDKILAKSVAEYPTKVSKVCYALYITRKLNISSSKTIEKSVWTSS